MQADIAQPLHVGTLLRCFLCHEPLPRPYKVDIEDYYHAWQGRLVSCTFHLFQNIVGLLAH